MNASQSVWDPSEGWTGEREEADLVLMFGGRYVLSNQAPIAAARLRWPRAILLGCSAAGEIRDTAVDDDTLVATAIHFSHTPIALYHVPISKSADSLAAGVELAQQITVAGLVHVLVVSDGLHVNGSELVKGLAGFLPAHVTISGGLAGDGSRFEQTLVVIGDEVKSGVVAAVAFYGNHIRVGCGSLGGWDQFGKGRLITRSEGNVLYEVDGRSALGIYKEYLGEHAAQLPSSGLLFPLAIRPQAVRAENDAPLVRTILGVDEAAQSLTFAGDIPQGWYTQLMRANFERLIDGAHGAAEAAIEHLGGTADLAILISCVGRKLIMKQRVEEEIEAVREVVGPGTCLAGFYSYGELAPFSAGTRCELHNQTMTVTAFREV